MDPVTSAWSGVVQASTAQQRPREPPNSTAKEGPTNNFFSSRRNCISTSQSRRKPGAGGSLRGRVYFVKFHKDVVRPGVMQLLFYRLFKIAVFFAASGWSRKAGCRPPNAFGAGSGAEVWRDLASSKRDLDNNELLLRWAKLPSANEALRRAVCRVHKDNVFRVASRRIQGQKDYWGLKDAGQSVNDMALEEE